MFNVLLDVQPAHEIFPLESSVGHRFLSGLVICAEFQEYNCTFLLHLKNVGEIYYRQVFLIIEGGRRDR